MIVHDPVYLNDDNIVATLTTPDNTLSVGKRLLAISSQRWTGSAWGTLFGTAGGVLPPGAVIVIQGTAVMLVEKDGSSLSYPIGTHTLPHITNLNNLVLSSAADVKIAIWFKRP